MDFVAFSAVYGRTQSPPSFVLCSRYRTRSITELFFLTKQQKVSGAVLQAKQLVTVCITRFFFPFVAYERIKKNALTRVFEKKIDDDNNKMK